MDYKEPIPASEYCIHGKLYGDCDECDNAADIAFEAYANSSVPTLLFHPNEDHQRIPCNKTKQP